MYKDKNRAHIRTKLDYQIEYRNSIKNPDLFWANKATRLTWYKTWNKVSNVDYRKAHIQWFDGGQLNVSYNCIDRHVESGHGSKCALIWEGNNPTEDKKYTYSELLDEVSIFSKLI